MRFPRREGIRNRGRCNSKINPHANWTKSKTSVTLGRRASMVELKRQLIKEIQIEVERVSPSRVSVKRQVVTHSIKYQYARTEVNADFNAKQSKRRRAIVGPPLALWLGLGDLNFSCVYTNTEYTSSSTVLYCVYTQDARIRTLCTPRP